MIFFELKILLFIFYIFLLRFVLLIILLKCTTRYRGLSKQLLCVQDNGRSCQRRFSVKNVFLKISQNSQENTCARVSFWIKLQTSSCNFIKKQTLAQVFSCTFCEIFKNTFFTEYLRVTTSTTGRQHFTAEKS